MQRTKFREGGGHGESVGGRNLGVLCGIPDHGNERPDCIVRAQRPLYPSPTTKASTLLHPLHIMHSALCSKTNFRTNRERIHLTRYRCRIIQRSGVCMRGKFSTHRSFEAAEWLREIAAIPLHAQRPIFHPLELPSRNMMHTSILHPLILRLLYVHGVWFAASATTPTASRCRTLQCTDKPLFRH